MSTHDREITEAIQQKIIEFGNTCPVCHTKLVARRGVELLDKANVVVDLYCPANTAHFNQREFISVTPEPFDLEKVRKERGGL